MNKSFLSFNTPEAIRLNRYWERCVGTRQVEYHDPLPKHYQKEKMANHKSVRASNVKLLGTSHSHVKRVTPLDTKRKQMKTAPDVSKSREKRTTRLRRDKEVKPI